MLFQILSRTQVVLLNTKNILQDKNVVEFILCRHILALAILKYNSFYLSRGMSWEEDTEWCLCVLGHVCKILYFGWYLIQIITFIRVILEGALVV